MLHPVSGTAADQVVTPLIDQPMQNTKAEEDGEAEHLVDVEGVAEDDGEEEELQDFLLALFQHVFLLDDADVAKEYPDQQIRKLHQKDNNCIEEDEQIQLVRGQVDERAEDGLVLIHRGSDNLKGYDHARQRINLENMVGYHY